MAVRYKLDLLIILYHVIQQCVLLTHHVIKHLVHVSLVLSLLVDLVSQ